MTSLLALDRTAPGRLLRSDTGDWRLAAQGSLLGALGSARLGPILLEIAGDLAKASEIFGFRLNREHVPEMLVSCGRRGFAARIASRSHRSARGTSPTTATASGASIMPGWWRRFRASSAAATMSLSSPSTAPRGNSRTMRRWSNSAGSRYRCCGDTGRCSGKRPASPCPNASTGGWRCTTPPLPIASRTIAGMTAEAIALDLGIGRTSVLTYRRRAYERYGMSSAGQFIEHILG
jgi:hypothetical protein